MSGRSNTDGKETLDCEMMNVVASLQNKFSGNRIRLEGLFQSLASDDPVLPHSSLSYLFWSTCSV